MGQSLQEKQSRFSFPIFDVKTMMIHPPLSPAEQIVWDAVRKPPTWNPASPPTMTSPIEDCMPPVQTMNVKELTSVRSKPLFWTPPAIYVPKAPKIVEKIHQTPIPKWTPPVLYMPPPIQALSDNQLMPAVNTRQQWTPPTCYVTKMSPPPMESVTTPEVNKMSHSNEDENKDSKKPYQCTVCSKRFKDPRFMRYHSRVHAKKRTPFICEHCDCRYWTKYSMRNHYFSNHAAKKIEHGCKDCGYIFWSIGGLRRHKRDRRCPVLTGRKMMYNQGRHFYVPNSLDKPVEEME